MRQSLGQWFGDSATLEYLEMSIDIFHGPNFDWGRMLLDRGKGCFYTPYNAQGRFHNKHFSSPNTNIAMAEKSCPTMTNNM